MVECPQPLVSLFADRFAVADSALRQLILEVLTWRYYRIRTLEHCRSLVVDDRAYVSAEYDHEGKRIHLFTTHADYPQLTQAAQAMFPLLAEVPADHDIAIDFYAFHAGTLGEAEAMQKEVQSMLSQAGFPRSIRRIVVAIGSPGPGRGMGPGRPLLGLRTTGRGVLPVSRLRSLHPLLPGTFRTRVRAPARPTTSVGSPYPVKPPSEGAPVENPGRVCEPGALFQSPPGAPRS